jgi:hypothetical protein
LDTYSKSSAQKSKLNTKCDKTWKLLQASTHPANASPKSSSLPGFFSPNSLDSAQEIDNI